MNEENFSIDLREMNSIRIWEVEDVPHPNVINGNIAQYRGQRYVEQLMRVVNQKIYRENEDRYLDSLFQIFDKSLEEGVEDVGKILWDDRSYYTGISWTAYSWKLPQELLKKNVDIEFRMLSDDKVIGKMTVPIKKLADDSGSIRISPRLFSSMRLKVGYKVNIRMKYS